VVASEVAGQQAQEARRCFPLLWFGVAKVPLLLAFAKRYEKYFFAVVSGVPFRLNGAAKVSTPRNFASAPRKKTFREQNKPCPSADLNERHGQRLKSSPA